MSDKAPAKPMDRNKKQQSGIPIFWMLLVVGFGVFLCPAWAALDEEKALLARGEYREAITRLEAVLSRTPDQGEAMEALLAGLLAVGDYRRAAERGEAFLKRQAEARIAVKTAEAWTRLGEYDRAAGLASQASTAQALWWRGTLAKRSGRLQEARAAFEQAASRPSRAIAQNPAEQAAVAAALVELGKFQEANQLYRDAMQNTPENAAEIAAIRAQWGKLLLDKHNPGEAEGLFREALKINSKDTGALVGLAELAAGKWDSQAPAVLQQALDVNPNLAEARLLLVRILLEQGNYADAAHELDAAEKLNPRLLEAWSLRAVSEYLQGNTAAVEQEWIPRILGVNPSYGAVLAELADFAVLRRQYGPAVEFYRRALEKDSGLADARSNLGINLFRLGEEQEARKVLEEAYERDRYNVWTVNTLRLMDSFSRFDSFETARFRGKLHNKESALLRPYVEELLEESLISLTSRYGYKPSQKVVFEMYPDHEDFAVRTLGMPGLGALGASFGPVVAMDSPSARPLGEFHWGSTLWHELAHVITLGMTFNRVPRWFTEGLSTYEENRARPGWGDPMNLGIVQALKKDGLIPIEKLDGTFVRPKNPGQVAFAYFQSGLICEFIADQYGFPKILAMLQSYAKGASDASTIREALGLSLEEFDKAFREYAREKTYGFGEAVVADVELPEGAPEQLRQLVQQKPGGFLARLRLAADLRKQSKLAEAIAEAKAAKELFPLYADDNNPYELLADIYLEQGQKEQAAAELLAWRKQKGREPKTFKKLANLLEELGRRKEAIQTLEEALHVSMFDVEIHEKLGAWHLEEGNARGALREYRAALALDPPDKAEAHYRLATAYWKLSEPQNARREILSALEIAPGYRPAQRLLLELSGR